MASATGLHRATVVTMGEGGGGAALAVAGRGVGLSGLSSGQTQTRVWGRMGGRDLGLKSKRGTRILA